MSGGFVRGEVEGEEEEEEVLILDNPKLKFSRELVEKVRGRGFGSEVELLQFLVTERPCELGLGREHYLDRRELEEFMMGLCLKLDIHGYEDRAKRLRYLNEVLGAKFVNKENVYKIVIQFLTAMAERPTAVTQMFLNSEEYSKEPDEEEEEEDDHSERDKALLKEILGEENEDPPPQSTSYSSGDSLSDWSSEEEEDISTKSNNSLPPGLRRPVRTSSSFGEFKDICTEKKEDPEKIRKEVELYWKNEKEKSKQLISSTVRRFETFPLQSQPVISSLLVLHARWGEHWEWKQRQILENREPQLNIAFVEDVVREVLWQFVITRADTSPVFNLDWSVKSDLMVASLSRSAFSGLLGRFGQVLGKLQTLRKFQEGVMTQCHRYWDGGQSQGPELELKAPSKIFRNYASGLQDILIFIMEHIDKIERDLKRLPREEKDPSGPACTTFLQLKRQTEDIVKIIEWVYKVHSKCVTSGPEENEEDDPWLASLKLISCIEVHLVQETRPSLHGILLFLYSKCLHALLDEILGALKSLKWDERYSLFVRDPTVLLNNPNFWSDCIKIRDLPFNSFSLENFIPLGCLHKLLPKVLHILKTCEVFDQLEEDYNQILGDATEIRVELLVQEFLVESLSSCRTPPLFLKKLNMELEVSLPEEDGGGDDFFKHFEALGMEMSAAANCFRFLQDPDYLASIQPKKKRQSLHHRLTFKDFVDLPSIPTISHALTLDKVLSKWFDPFCLSAKQRIGTIFHEYKVLERMTIFREIILTVREDFARGIILIAAKDPSIKSSSSHSHLATENFEDKLARNSKFQRLLNDCYPPECRGDTFSIDLKLDRTSDMNCVLDVTPKFPLNLIVTPQSVAGYLFIGRQLHRIRKSLWNASSLSMKTCCVAPPPQNMQNRVDPNRILIFRFCLVNFCSSLRSFFMLKVFSKDFAEGPEQASSTASQVGCKFENDLDYMRKVHENYLDLIQTKMLRHPLIENILLKKMGVMSETLRKQWTVGMSQSTMLQMEDTLKKCWQVVNDFESIKYGPDFNELSWHFGRPPSYLTN